MKKMMIGLLIFSSFSVFSQESARNLSHCQAGENEYDSLFEEAESSFDIAFAGRLQELPHPYNAIPGKYLGHYRDDVDQPCMVRVSAPYGQMTVAIHRRADLYSDYFDLGLEYFRPTEDRIYFGEDPDLGEILTFKYKVNENKELTEASVFNQAIRSNTIECVNLKVQ